MSISILIFFWISAFIPSLYLLSFVYCLQATRSRGRILSNSLGPALSDTNRGNKSEKRDGARERTLPLSQIQSWQAPMDWHSSMHASGELESFASANRPSQVSFGLKRIDMTKASQFRPADLFLVLSAAILKLRPSRFVRGS